MASCDAEVPPDLQAVTEGKFLTTLPTCDARSGADFVPGELMTAVECETPVADRAPR